jgi:hypothetical protein
MLALILIIVALVLFGGGFAYSILWYAAVIALILALVSFMTGRSAV